MKAQKPLPPAYPQTLKTLGDHLRKKRLDLKLLQREVAQRIGAHESTVSDWENNREKPSLYYLPKIIEFLSYVPYEAEVKTFREKLRTLRRSLGLSQENLAKSLGIDPNTINRWERGKGNPSKKLLERVKKKLNL